MKLKNGFQGKVIANITKVYSPYNFEEVKTELTQSVPVILNTLVSDSKSIGGWEYIYFNDNNSLHLRTVYNKYNKMYESMSNENFSYFIKIVKLCEI